MSLGRWLAGLLLGLGALAIFMGTKAANSAPQRGQSSIILSAKDEAAIRGVVSAFAKSWMDQDMDAMHAIDAEDVDWINVTGNHWRGKANVRRGHTNFLRTIGTKEAVKIDQVLVRLIAPGVAIAVTTLRFSSSDEHALRLLTPTGAVATGKTRGSFVLVKQGKSWKVAHFQNTIVDPLAEEHDPLDWDKTGFDPRKAPQEAKP